MRATTVENSSKKYLQSDLNLATMYKLYTQATDRVVSLSKYSEIFHTVGLKFKRPQLDTCTTCDELKLKIRATEGQDQEHFKTQQKSHQESADFAYATKKSDISAASPTSMVFAFDLQQCLPTPHLQSSVSFYKRQLNTFNLTVHDCNSGKLSCT